MADEKAFERLPLRSKFGLTQGELVVFQTMVDEELATTKQLAVALCYSPRTITNRISSASRKLGTSGKFETMLTLLVQGYISLPSQPVSPQIERHRVSPSILSRSERQILEVMVRGGPTSNPAIAEALGRTPGTIRNQVSGIVKKFEAVDRTQALVLAVQAGEIEIPEKNEISVNLGFSEREQREHICRS